MFGKSKVCLLGGESGLLMPKLHSPPNPSQFCILVEKWCKKLPRNTSDKAILGTISIARTILYPTSSNCAEAFPLTVGTLQAGLNYRTTKYNVRKLSNARSTNFAAKKPADTFTDRNNYIRNERLPMHLKHRSGELPNSNYVNNLLGTAPTTEIFGNYSSAWKYAIFIDFLPNEAERLDTAFWHDLALYCLEIAMRSFGHVIMFLVRSFETDLNANATWCLQTISSN